MRRRNAASTSPRVSGVSGSRHTTASVAGSASCKASLPARCATSFTLLVVFSDLDHVLTL